MTTYPTTDCEPPNPYASPQEVATGDVVLRGQLESEKSRDHKYETVGFAALTIAGVCCIGVSAGLWWLLDHFLEFGPIPLQAVVGLPAVALMMVGGPLALVCFPWTLLSAARWIYTRRADQRVIEEGRP